MKIASNSEAIKQMPHYDDLSNLEITKITETVYKRCLKAIKDSNSFQAIKDSSKNVEIQHAISQLSKHFRRYEGYASRTAQNEWKKEPELCNEENKEVMEKINALQKACEAKCWYICYKALSSEYIGSPRFTCLYNIENVKDNDLLFGVKG